MSFELLPGSFPKAARGEEQSSRVQPTETPKLIEAFGSLTTEYRVTSNAENKALRRKRIVVKLLRAYGGCLGAGRRRRTWQAAKSLGELQASVDPGVSEWGNPAGVILRHSFRGEPTQGTETSKYLQEKTSNEIP